MQYGKVIYPFYSRKNERKIPAFFCALLLLALVAGTPVPAEDKLPVILAFGDSLTAGFGVSPGENYPARLQTLLDEQGYSYRVVNAGVSGDTTAGGLRRIGWLLKHDPEIVILELGANDGLRGTPVEETHSNLQQIIQICRERGAKVLLTGMKIPPNYGEPYSRDFEGVFHRLAKQFDLPFIPFFLDGVAAHRDLTQADGIHPLGPGYSIVVETVWKSLEPLLKKKSG